MSPKKRDIINVLNRAAALIEAYANADALNARQSVLTSTEVQELVEDLINTANDLVQV